MVQNLKDLEKLLKLLRKQGVQDFKMGEIALKLGDLPQEMAAQDEDTGEAFPSDEQLLDWALGPQVANQ